MPTDNLDLPEDERTVELSSLEAIFPELVIESTTKAVCEARIDIEVDLLGPLDVLFTSTQEDGIFRPHGTPPEQSGTNRLADGTAIAKPAPEHVLGNVIQLTHLPSITCHISLPESYPEQSAPEIKLLSKIPWLPDARLRELSQRAGALWEEYGRNVMLFDYLDGLAQSAHDGFGLLDSAGPIVLSRDYETALLDFDLQAKKRKFEEETFDCGVCLEPKKGAVCHQMADCEHVFCRPCLQDFYNNCITEGDVGSVKCLFPGCEKDRLKEIPEKKRRKADLTLSAGELVEVQIEFSMVQRYVKMKRKKELESNKNTVYCPRRWCQGAARQQPGNSDPDGGSEDEEAQKTTESTPEEQRKKKYGERLAICSDCSFAFCSYCLNGWHGEHVDCHPPRSAKELSEEEKATEAYLSEHSTSCPTCGARTQKTMGCNHMLCRQCRSHFCYLCSAYLMPANPYEHYNTPGQGCYQQLWVLEGGDFEGAPAQFPIAAAAELPPELGDDNIPFVADAAAIPEAAPPAARAPANAVPEVVVIFEDDTESSEEDEVAPPPVRGGRGRGRGGVGANRGRGEARGRGQGAGRGGGGRGRQPRQQRPVAVVAAPGPARGPLPAHEQNALQRFLVLAQRDMEDEWDSDELDSDDDDEAWAIPVR